MNPLSLIGGLFPRGEAREEWNRDKVSIPPLSQGARAEIQSLYMAKKDRKNNLTTMNTGAALGKSVQGGDIIEMHVAFFFFFKHLY